MFKIILAEDKMTTSFGTLYKGDLLEVVMSDDESEIERYILSEYKMEGINVDYVRVESW